MSFLIYRQPTQTAFQLVLSDWDEVEGITSVPLFSTAAPGAKFINLVPADSTAEYGRKALITVETSEIVIAMGRDIVATDKLFIPPGGNIELDVGKQRVCASVFDSVNAASVQVWTAKYFKVTS